MARRSLAAALAIAALAILAPAFSDAAQPREETEADLLFAAPDEARVNAAMDEARRTLPVFWGKYEAKDPNVSGFFVKVGFPVRDGGREHIWCEVLRRTRKDILVRIENDPVYIGNLEYGQKVRVTPDMITDWAYVKGGKRYGHFTTRVMLDRASPEQRAELEGMLAPTAIESEAP